ncbi:MAG TPA: hypothetical protein VFG47_22220 [Geminicoccaceae bacterium]|nr:hypothetical protein [Geminicoccaceae bacterium]
MGFAPIRSVALAALVGCLGLAGFAGSGAAVDASGARLHGLGRDLSAIAPRLRSDPGRVGFALDRARRQLRALEIEARGDPELERLRREVTRLQWRADRASLRRAREAGLRRLEQGRERLPVPDFLRAPYDTSLYDTERPIGAGRLFIFLQNSLRGAERDVRRGRIGAARASLAEAEGAYARIAAAAAAGEAIPPDDPNLVAARRQIASLRDQLRGLERGTAGEG